MYTIWFFYRENAFLAFLEIFIILLYWVYYNMYTGCFRKKFLPQFSSSSYVMEPQDVKNMLL